MTINILGPLEATIGARSIVPSAMKPKKVLALLLANTDHIVPISQIKFEIWDESLPSSSSTTLQTYILQLRKLIAEAARGSGPAAKDVLVTKPVGYMFRAHGERSDVEEYERMARAGTERLGAGDAESAARLLRQALDLWRGPALADVEPGQLLQAYAVRLRESRLHTVSRRIEAELILGNHEALLGEIAVLVLEEPYNETLRAQYMIALYRSGRRVEALDTFRRMRALLIDEIGLDPSPRLHQLHQAILTSDPALEAGPTAPAAAHTVAAIPAYAAA